MRNQRLCGWTALVMLFTGIACLDISPSYACACTGENPGGSLVGWLFVGVGAVLFCGTLIITLLLTIREWRHTQRSGHNEP